MPRLFNPASGTANLDAAVSSRAAEANYVALRAGTLVIPVVRPANAVGVTVTAGAGAWTKGAYAQIVAAADLAGHALSMIYVNQNLSAAEDCELDIAVGGAGLEVIIGTFLFNIASAAQGMTFGQLVWPMLQIPANARVAARSSAATSAPAFILKLGFTPRPL